MKIKFILFLLCLLFSRVEAQNFPEGKKILQKIDDNMSSKNRVYVSKMIIHGRRAERVLQAKSWAVGDEKAFTEYLAPAREKGTKMLKLQDKLWMYNPGSDRIIQISGHMLRQSVMGSDLSYEDMMEDKKLQESYHAVVVAQQTFAGRPCWIVELTANTENFAYAQRKLWVDSERNIPLKQELYARSGTLLKKMELTDVEKINGRWFPKRMIFKDMLKRGKGTEFIISEIKFDQEIPAHIFSKAALRK